MGEGGFETFPLELGTKETLETKMGLVVHHVPEK